MTQSKASISWEDLKRHLLDAGFPEETADSHIVELYDIVTLSIAKRISLEILREEQVDLKKVTKYLEKNANNPLVANILKTEPQQILRGYLANIAQ
jgi:hypothetical protein